MSKTLRGDHNQCPSCNLYFNSTRAFDKHRIGDFGKDRRCKTVVEMVEAGMSEAKDGFWITQKMEKRLTELLP